MTGSGRRVETTSTSTTEGKNNAKKTDQLCRTVPSFIKHEWEILDLPSAIDLRPLSVYNANNTFNT